VKVLLKLVCYTYEVSVRNYVQYFLHIVAFLMCITANCSWSLVYCVIILCVSLLPHVYCFYYVCIAVSHTLVAGLLARSHYP